MSKNNTNEVSPQPFSYHIFMFPFIFSKSDYIEYIEECGNWRKIGNESIEYEEAKDRYNMKQYFNENARKVITRANLGTDIERGNQVLNSYMYDFNMSEQSSSRQVYSIYRKTKDGKSEDKYELDVKRVILDLYDSNVGILSFELENHKHPSIAEIKKINDLGRRISLACVQGSANEDKSVIINADRLVMSGVDEYEDYKDISVDFYNIVGKLESAESFIDPSISALHGYSQIVYFFLTRDEKNENVQFKRDSNEKSNVVLTPLVDDRMFTVCLILNKTLSWKVKEVFSDSYDDVAYMNKREIKQYMSELCSIIFVDNEGSSCQNFKMQLEALEKNCYKRWCNYGTLFGVTQHSFICISDIGTPTSDDYIDNYRIIVLPFLTMYKEMVKLVLAQRATIIELSNEASEIACNLNTHKNSRVVKKVKKLQERYVKFQNEVLLFEITSQQQGIELYQMLRRELFVIEQKDELENQLNNLYEIANMYANDSLNRKVMALTYVSIFLTLVGLFLDQCSYDNCGWIEFLICCARSAGLVGIIYVISVFIKKIQK